MYKTTKLYVIKIVTPQDEFEDTIYIISNRQGKTKEVTVEIITTSKLIHTNISTTTSIPDIISFTTPMPSLKSHHIYNLTLNLLHLPYKLIALRYSGLWNKELRN